MKSVAKYHKLGFSIPELLIVIAVIAILTTIGFVSYGAIQTNARDNAVLSDAESVHTEITRYSVKNAGVLGYAVEWYSPGASNPNIQFTPSDKNIVDVVANATDYCVRVYNESSSKYKTIYTAAIKESAENICNTLGPSAQAINGSPADDTVAFVGAEGADTGSSNSNTVTVGVPASTSSGNLMLANIQLINGGDAASIITPAGWTEIEQHSISSPNRLAQAVFYRLADNEPVSYNFQSVGASDCCKLAGVISVYSNVDASDPIAGSSATSIATTTSTGAHEPVTAAADGYVVVLGGGRGSSVSLGTPTVGTYSVRAVGNTQAASWMNAYVADGRPVASDATITPPAAVYGVNASSLMLSTVVLRADN